MNGAALPMVPWSGAQFSNFADDDDALYLLEVAMRYI